jgi:hypothetical protein
LPDRKGCPNRKLNAEKCPCDVADCPRRGICCECIEFHRLLGEAPACIVQLGEKAAAKANAALETSEAVEPRADDFRIIDFASCAG